MRREAFVVLTLSLLASGLAWSCWDERRAHAQPLACQSVAVVIEADGDRLVCLTDPSLAACPNARGGYRYRLEHQACVETSAMPGPVMLMRGLPLSARDATADDLVALQGVGPGLAGKFVAARAAGPFCGPEDLRRIPGFGAKRSAMIGSHLVFDDPECGKKR